MPQSHPDPAVTAALEALRLATSALERAAPPPTTPADPLPRWLRAREVATILGLSPKHVYALMASGHLPTVRMNRSVRVPEDALRAYMDRLTAEAASPAARVTVSRHSTLIARRGRHGATPR